MNTEKKPEDAFYIRWLFDDPERLEDAFYIRWLFDDPERRSSPTRSLARGRVDNLYGGQSRRDRGVLK